MWVIAHDKGSRYNVDSWWIRRLVPASRRISNIVHRIPPPPLLLNFSFLFFHIPNCRWLLGIHTSDHKTRNKIPDSSIRLPKAKAHEQQTKLNLIHHYPSLCVRMQRVALFSVCVCFCVCGARVLLARQFVSPFHLPSRPSPGGGLECQTSRQRYKLHVRKGFIPLVVFFF